MVRNYLHSKKNANFIKVLLDKAFRLTCSILKNYTEWLDLSVLTSLESFACTVATLEGKTKSSTDLFPKWIGKLSLRSICYFITFMWKHSCAGYKGLLSRCFTALSPRIRRYNIINDFSSSINEFHLFYNGFKVVSWTSTCVKELKKKPRRQQYGDYRGKWSWGK